MESHTPQPAKAGRSDDVIKFIRQTRVCQTTTGNSRHARLALNNRACQPTVQSLFMARVVTYPYPLLLARPTDERALLVDETQVLDPCTHGLPVCSGANPIDLRSLVAGYELVSTRFGCTSLLRVCT